MTPSHVHSNSEALSSAGWLPIRTTFGGIDAPGTHGAGVAGTQGAGVNTPSAAEVAAITAGFVGAWHIPNGMMFVIGMWSMIFASGTLLVVTLLTGKTTSALGVIPKLHDIMAPLQTCSGMLKSPSFLPSYPTE